MIKILLNFTSLIISCIKERFCRRITTSWRDFQFFVNLSRVYLEAVIGGCNQANHEVVWRIRPAGSTGSHKDALKCPKETPFRSNPTGLTPLRSRAGVRAVNEGIARWSSRSDMSIGILGTMYVQFRSILYYIYVLLMSTRV